MHSARSFFLKKTQSLEFEFGRVTEIWVCPQWWNETIKCQGVGGSFKFLNPLQWGEEKGKLKKRSHASGHVCR